VTPPPVFPPTGGGDPPKASAFVGYNPARGFVVRAADVELQADELDQGALDRWTDAFEAAQGSGPPDALVTQLAVLMGLAPREALP